MLVFTRYYGFFHNLQLTIVTNQPEYGRKSDDDRNSKFDQQSIFESWSDFSLCTQVKLEVLVGLEQLA